jgi:hypothetical protein
MLVPSTPWATVLRFYEGLASKNECFLSMHRLVEHIAAQPYARLLFCATSMHDLLVSRHAQIEWLHDMLRVQPASEAALRFTFHEPFSTPAAWECSNDNAVKNFEAFLRSSKWVTDLGR